MSAQRQRPISAVADQPQAETAFAMEGLLLAHRVGGNCGVRVQSYLPLRYNITHE
jgi:hypothetical protein